MLALLSLLHSRGRLRRHGRVGVKNAVWINDRAGHDSDLESCQVSGIGKRGDIVEADKEFGPGVAQSWRVRVLAKNDHCGAAICLELDLGNVEHPCEDSSVGQVAWEDKEDGVRAPVAGDVKVGLDSGLDQASCWTGNLNLKLFLILMSSKYLDIVRAETKPGDDIVVGTVNAGNVLIENVSAVNMVVASAFGNNVHRVFAVKSQVHSWSAFDSGTRLELFCQSVAITHHRIVDVDIIKQTLSEVTKAGILDSSVSREELWTRALVGTNCVGANSIDWITVVVSARNQALVEIGALSSKWKETG